MEFKIEDNDIEGLIDSAIEVFYDTSLYMPSIIILSEEGYSYFEYKYYSVVGFILVDRLLFKGIEVIKSRSLKEDVIKVY
tara:strand:+ start:2460 stop:2699 length:240 start_codon:yes stop_codon:yes gene_type:complete